MIVDTNMKRRIDDLVMELTEEFGEPPDEAEEAMNARPSRPDILVKTVVATRDDIHAFGRQLAAAAWQRGFAASERKAFVADGLAANWTVWQKHFSHYTPILDFVHAVMYVYAAAMAGRDFPTGWRVYCDWARLIWSGRVADVIAARACR